MKVAFYSNSIKFDGDVLENGLSGGSENAFVNIVRSWKKNNPNDCVIVYNNNSGKYSEYDGIIWKSIIDFYSDVRSFNLDVLVSLRDPSIFSLSYINSKLKILWSQDIMNEPRLIELQKNKYNIDNIDIIFANSVFSHNNLKDGFPNSDIRILLNGYNSDFICDDVEKEDIAIWNSTPFRGIEYLLEFWPKIYKSCNRNNLNPKLEIYGGMSLYHQSDEYFKDLYVKLSSMKNTTVIGSVPQKELYKRMCKSRLLLYPNTHCETSCMSMIEAISCGVWPVSTNLGALNELIINDKTGNIINGNPDNEEYKKYFVYYAVKSFMNKIKPNNDHLKTWNEQSKKMRNIIKEKL